MRRRSLLQGIGGLAGALLLGKTPESTALTLPAAAPPVVPPVFPPVLLPVAEQPIIQGILATEGICLKKFAAANTISDAALLRQGIAMVGRQTAIDMAWPQHEFDQTYEIVVESGENR